ncbi:MAG: single-stranded DNA-binding protein [Pseudomonadota bacterium]
MNQIHLIGRLGADPRITPYSQKRSRKQGQQPRQVVSFDLAVEWSGQNPNTGEISTDWIPVTFFDGAAGRFAANHLANGDRVAVTGRLEATHWAGEQDPARKFMRVIAREIIGLDYHRHGSGEESEQPAMDIGHEASAPTKQEAVQ